MRARLLSQQIYSEFKIEDKFLTTEQKGKFYVGQIQQLNVFGKTCNKKFPCSSILFHEFNIVQYSVKLNVKIKAG